MMLAGKRFPLIAGVISTPEALAPSPSLRHCDVVEVRYDQLGMPLPEALKAISTIRPLCPVLFTHRWQAEGGRADDDEARTRIYAQAIPHVDLIDIEANSQFGEVVVAQANKAQTVPLLSFHDFSAMPPVADLEALVSRIRRLGAVPKLAVTADSEAACDQLEAFLLAQCQTPICVIGMGAAAQHTRVHFPRLGSCLTYGYLDTPSAPGQPSCAELRHQLKP